MLHVLHTSWEATGESLTILLPHRPYLPLIQIDHLTIIDICFLRPIWESRAELPKGSFPRCNSAQLESIPHTSVKIWVFHSVERHYAHAAENIQGAPPVLIQVSGWAMLYTRSRRYVGLVYMIIHP